MQLPGAPPASVPPFARSARPEPTSGALRAVRLAGFLRALRGALIADNGTIRKT